MNKKIRVRYAPSPTGQLHIGNARTALFNYLFAKHYDGEFIVRIEDTDIKRNTKDGAISQLDNLKWLGISWDESIDKDGKYGPYNQIKRHEEGIYNKYVQKLLDEGMAYKCFCTSKDLEIDAQKQKEYGLIPKYSGKCRNLSPDEIKEKEKENIEYTIRLKVDANKKYSWTDIVKNKLEFLAKDVTGDFNILKRDGIPTYNFAVVIDDYLMKISHVLRGEDHISNTPKQLMIYEALNFEEPIFGHMPLIVGSNGKKLSKRDEGIIQFISQYKEKGYLPEALFNFISLLGWSPVGEDEIFSKNKLIEIFDEKRLSNSSAFFDVNKLSWINSQYIKEMNDEEYLGLTFKYIKEININYDEETLKNILLLYKNQISYGKEIEEVSQLFFSKTFSIDDDGLKFLLENDTKLVLNTFLNKITNAKHINSIVIKEIIKEVKNDTNIKGKLLFMPIRIASTGQIHGPDLTDTLEILGKDKIINNINYSLGEIDE